MNRHRTDVFNRLELLFGTVEFSVLEEYWSLEPKPHNCIFAIDVSWNSIQSGIPFLFCNALKSSLYGFSNNGYDQVLNPEARIGFSTYDKTAHFYNLKVFKYLLICVFS